MLETKYARFEPKLGPPDGADAEIFEGYASIFDEEDAGRDVIAPGAFARTLADRGLPNAMGVIGDIKMLLQHDPNQPIGVWRAISEDARGLRVRGRLITAVPRAAETLELMRAGALDGLSIGFKTVKASRDQETGARRILDLELWEISLVTFPMLASARIAAPIADETPDDPSIAAEALLQALDDAAEALA